MAIVIVPDRIHQIQGKKFCQEQGYFFGGYFNQGIGKIKHIIYQCYKVVNNEIITKEYVFER